MLNINYRDYYATPAAKTRHMAETTASATIAVIHDKLGERHEVLANVEFSMSVDAHYKND